MKRISRAKKNTILIVSISVLVVLIGFMTAFFISRKHLRTQFELEQARLEQTLLSNERNIYLAKVEIPAGTKITKDNTVLTQVYSSQPLEFYITEKDFNKVASVDIKDGQTIFTTMVGEDVDTDIRETEYALINLSTNLKQNDFVDVRIMYTNGENYTVLAKKDIKQLNLANNDIFLWLKEDEIMLMSSAIVDTYLHRGSILYTTKYVEDAQEATIPNYVPTQDCMIAISNDPNIVDKATMSLNASVRASLDNRLLNNETNNNIDLITSLPNKQDVTPNKDNKNNDEEQGVLSGVNSTGEQPEDNTSFEDDENALQNNDESLIYEMGEDESNGY